MKNKFEIQSGDEVIIPEIGKFPGGEIRVRLPSRPAIESRITAYLFNSDDVMTLMMLVDAMRNMGCISIRLTMPYIPYARQDRVCNEGEAFSIRVFAKIINSLGFASVSVWDAHSDVSTKLIERCIDIPSEQLMMVDTRITQWIRHRNLNEYPMYLVSPDKGAVEKTKAIFTAIGQFKGIIQADKERDLATGKIIRTVVKGLPDDIANARLLVVDDICDGGRTFIELAKVLRPYCKEMSLYVTHGIFSQGMEVFEPFYDNVWCTVNFKEFE
jgi:ribose-phosphate pyrophosphokinase